MSVYTARCQGVRLDSASLQGAVKAACRWLRIPESDAFTVQKDLGHWLLVADPRDSFGCAMIEIAPVQS